MALTVIPMAMICGHGLAAGLTPQEIRQVSEDIKTAYTRQDYPKECDSGDNYEPQCYEKNLQFYSSIARREGKKLILKMQNGERIYTDFSDGTYGKHEFMGYIEALDMFLLTHWTAMDASADVLLDRKNGKETLLYDARNIRFNADGSRMLNYQYSELNGSGVVAFSYDKNAGLTLIYDDAGENGNETDKKSCIDWGGQRTNDDRYYLDDFTADWSGNADEIVIAAKYSDTSFHIQHNCNITSH